MFKKHKKDEIESTEVKNEEVATPNKKKKITIIVVIILSVLVVAGVVFLIVRAKFSGGGESEIIEEFDSGNYITPNRFMGVVQSQEVTEIAKPEGEIEAIHVKEGDNVDVGTALYTINVSTYRTDLEQKKLSLEEQDHEITAYQNQIEQQKKALATAASEAEKNEINVEISSLELSVQRAEYEKKSINLEIEELNKKINNATVKSTVKGIVKAVCPEGTDANGNMKPLISILAGGDYRIKGSVNEMNISGIAEGMPVTIYSRVNDDTWTGVIETIDTGSTEGSEDSMMGQTSETTSSRYNFYVAIDDASGLMFGQHVYIEPSM